MICCCPTVSVSVVCITINEVGFSFLEVDVNKVYFLFFVKSKVLTEARRPIRRR